MGDKSQGEIDISKVSAMARQQRDGCRGEEEDETGEMMNFAGNTNTAAACRRRRVYADIQRARSTAPVSCREEVDAAVEVMSGAAVLPHRPCGEVQQARPTRRCGGAKA